MYNHTLHCGRKDFCRYCLQALSTKEILKSDIKDFFKINGKQKIIMPEKGEFVKFKKYKRTIKSPFIIHADLTAFLCQKIMEIKIQKRQTDIKNILLGIMDISQYVSMINLVSLLKHTLKKMQFTISLIV